MSGHRNMEFQMTPIENVAAVFSLHMPKIGRHLDTAHKSWVPAAELQEIKKSLNEATLAVDAAIATYERNEPRARTQSR